MQYKGRESFRTTLGGVVSLILLFVVFLYSMVKLTNFVAKKRPEQFMNSIYHNFTDIGPLSFQDLNFDFQFGVLNTAEFMQTGKSLPKKHDPRMIKVIATARFLDIKK